MTTEMMERTPSAELIGRKIVLTLNETESIRRDHVVKIALTSADRAIAFTYPRELGSNLELDAATVARSSIGSHFGFRCHIFLLAAEGDAAEPLIRKLKSLNFGTGSSGVFGRLIFFENRIEPCEIAENPQLGNRLALETKQSRTQPLDEQACCAVTSEGSHM
jgi:hypothetical protein